MAYAEVREDRHCHADVRKEILHPLIQDLVRTAKYLLSAVGQVLLKLRAYLRVFQRREVHLCRLRYSPEYSFTCWNFFLLALLLAARKTKQEQQRVET